MWYIIDKCPQCGYPSVLFFPQHDMCRVCVDKEKYTPVTNKPGFTRPQLIEDIENGH